MSRLKKQRRDQRRREASLLRVTVVSHPSHILTVQDGPTSEVPLVRSALLYADSIELISPIQSVVDLVEAVQEAGRRLSRGILDPKTDYLRRYLDRTADGPREEEIWKILDNKVAEEGISTDLSEEKLREALMQAFDAENQRNEEQWKTRTRERGHDDIQRLMDLGIVTPADNGYNNSKMDSTWGPASWLAGWWNELVGRMGTGGARLLLDDESQREVAEALEKGLVRPGALFEQRAGEVMAGTGLIARLPAFPMAPLDELLDLRTDLQDPLTRYRSAVVRLAHESNLKIGPDSASRIDDLWLHEVEPAILSIKEQMHDHGLVRELAASVGADIQTFLAKGAALGVGLGALTDLAAWVSALIGVGAPGAEATYKGWKASHEGQTAAARSDLFYLYEADRRLSR
jgi:hypothetical protein